MKQIILFITALSFVFLANAQTSMNMLNDRYNSIGLSLGTSFGDAEADGFGLNVYISPIDNIMFTLNFAEVSVDEYLGVDLSALDAEEESYSFGIGYIIPQKMNNNVHFIPNINFGNFEQTADNVETLDIDYIDFGILIRNQLDNELILNYSLDYIRYDDDIVEDYYSLGLGLEKNLSENAYLTLDLETAEFDTTALSAGVYFAF